MTVPLDIRDALCMFVKLERQGRIEPDAELFCDLGMDSLDIVSLAIELEEKQGFEFPQGTELGWHTVGDVMRAFPLRPVS